MRYIKIFESVGFESDIKEFWRVDPFEFQRILTDALEEIDIWGDISISFVIYYPYPNNDSESKPIFYLKGDESLRRGPWFDNFNSLKEYSTQEMYDLGKSSIPGIEVMVNSPEEERLSSHRHEDVKRFKNFIYRYFRERDVKYGIMSGISYWTDSYGIDFIYTGDL